MKLVLNKCYGGFNLSEKALTMLPYTLDFYTKYSNRDNSSLVKVVESLDKKASGAFANLKVIELPKGYTDFKIFDYDGVEAVIYVKNGKLHEL